MVSEFEIKPWLSFSCCRLGFTFLRLKDNYMEILNRDNDLER
jgi:hypothetical protein